MRGIRDVRFAPTRGSAKWRPSSFTQYTNGRTASREDKRPDPSKGGLYDNRQKLGRMPSLPIFRGAEISGYRALLTRTKFRIRRLQGWRNCHRARKSFAGVLRKD